VSNTIVKRDASGDFAAGTITADLAGTATNALTSVFFSGTLLGEVTGNQSSTSIANTVVTAKTLTGYSNLSPIPLSATDTILQALGKLQGQLFSVSDEISLSQNLELKTNRQKVMGSLETSSDILLEGTATLILV
jgi:hypothetical protein